MGLFRKTTSALTLGAVDFKSDKERIASYTKATAKEARKQTKVMQRATKEKQPSSVEKLAQIRAYEAEQERLTEQAELDEAEVDLTGKGYEAGY